MLDAEGVGIGEGFGVGDAGGEEGEGEIVAAIDGEVADGVFREGVGLLGALGLEERDFGSDVEFELSAGDVELDVEGGFLADG